MTAFDCPDFSTLPHVNDPMPAFPAYVSLEGNQYDKYIPSTGMEKLYSKLCGCVRGVFQAGLYADAPNDGLMYLGDDPSEYYLPAVTLQPTPDGKTELETRAVAASFLISKTRVWAEVVKVIDQKVTPAAKLAVKRGVAHIMCAIAGFGEGIFIKDATTDVTSVSETLAYIDVDAEIFESIEKSREIQSTQAPRIIAIMAYNAMFKTGNFKGNYYQCFNSIQKHFLALLKSLAIDETVINLLYNGTTLKPKFSEILCELICNTIIHDSDANRFFYYLNNREFLPALIGGLTNDDLSTFNPNYYGGTALCASKGVLEILQKLNLSNDGSKEHLQTVDNFLAQVTQNNRLGLIAYSFKAPTFLNAPTKKLPSEVKCVEDYCAPWAAAIKHVKSRRIPGSAFLKRLSIPGILNLTKSIDCVGMYGFQLGALSDALALHKNSNVAV
uniref:DUF1116 domain-containing protein n=1 Tax=Panagrellus redivivus TaxID=6233 RepID=A0A7E4VS24_PANRE